MGPLYHGPAWAAIDSNLEIGVSEASRTCKGKPFASIKTKDHPSRLLKIDFQVHKRVRGLVSLHPLPKDSQNRFSSLKFSGDTTRRDNFNSLLGLSLRICVGLGIEAMGGILDGTTPSYKFNEPTPNRASYVYYSPMDENILPLINACIAGDSHSWESFYEEFAPIAINILRRHYVSLSPDEVDDVVQNVFAKLLRWGLHSFQGESSCKSKYEWLAYFRTVVANEAKTFLITKETNLNIISIEFGSVVQDNEQLPPLEIIDANPRPDTVVEINDLFNKALQGASVEERQIVVLKAQEYKDKEIANLMGLPIGTVASKYARAKERMLRLFGK